MATDPVASRVPGPESIELSSAATRDSPGGSEPLTFQEPMLIVFETPKTTGVIDWPVWALRVELLFDSTRVVAPAIASMAPRKAARPAADFRMAPFGAGAPNSSPARMRFRTGVRCRRASSAAVGRFSQANWRWKRAEIFITMRFERLERLYPRSDYVFVFNCSN